MSFVGLVAPPWCINSSASSPVSRLTFGRSPILFSASHIHIHIRTLPSPLWLSVQLTLRHGKRGKWPSVVTCRFCWRRHLPWLLRRLQRPSLNHMQVHIVCPDCAGAGAGRGFNIEQSPPPKFTTQIAHHPSTSLTIPHHKFPSSAKPDRPLLILSLFLLPQISLASMHPPALQTSFAKHTSSDEPPVNRPRDMRRPPSTAPRTAPKSAMEARYRLRRRNGCRSAVTKPSLRSAIC